jgi:hypothetical protein
MRKSLINYIANAQLSIAETTFKHGMYSKNVNFLTEGYLHTFLFQVYAIEMLSKNQGSKTHGSDNLVHRYLAIRNNFLLEKLNKFYIASFRTFTFKTSVPSASKKREQRFQTEQTHPLQNRRSVRIANRRVDKIPGRRIYIPSVQLNVLNSNELRPLTIPSIIDRAIQQLFLLVLDPIIECNSDKYSFGFRKAHNQIMAIGTIQKKLQTKPSRVNLTSIDYPYI